jgi:hypothetical protein
MFTIIAVIIGDIVLTLAVVIGVICLTSKLGDWVNKHYGMKIRRLFTTLQANATDDTRRSRDKGEHKVEATNLVQDIHQCLETREHVDIARINPLHRTIQKQKEKRNAEYRNATPKRLTHLSLLRHIVSYCKQRINQSGKEPNFIVHIIYL